MNAAPTVLIIEDRLSLLDMYKVSLEKVGIMHVHLASTLVDAEKIFIENTSNGKKIDVILVDGSIHSHAGDPDTLPLIKKMRSCFTGPIIAISGDEKSIRLMVEAGCNGALKKPFLLKVLEEKVLELVQGK